MGYGGDGRNNIRSGTCRGGPISGQPLHHHADRYFMFKRLARDGIRAHLISYTMPDEGPSALPDDIEVGAYDYDGDGTWHWTREIE